MKLVKRLFFLFLLIAGACHARPMKSALLWDVTDVCLTRCGGDNIRLDIDFNVLDDAVASKSAVVLQPYLVAGGRKSVLRPISFYRLDGRGNRFRVRRAYDCASGVADEVSKVCGLSEGHLKYSDVADAFSDEDSVEVFVDVVEYRAMDKENFIESRKVACFYPMSCPEFYPDFFTVYVDDGEYPDGHYLDCTLNVTYDPKKKTTFDIRYEDNEGDVYEFVEAIKSVLDSPQTKVSSVSLKAYSGIEGPSRENFRVATARFNSVYSYLRKAKTFGRHKVSTRIVGEDWEGVYRWVRETFWANEKSVSDILFDSDMPDDVKEKRLCGEEPFWKNLEDFVFPELDRIECHIDYTLLPYDSDEERWKAYNEDRTMLSQYDYCCLIKSLNMWSSSWYDAIFDFAEVYPLCGEAQIDGFAAAISLGHLNEAGKYLRFLPANQDTRYYRAVWLMYMGDISGSYELAKTLDRSNLRYENTVNQITAIYNWSQSLTPWRKTVYPRFRR